MGEAKQKRERLKALVLREMQRWDFPPTDGEAQAVREISELPELVVRRYPAELLRDMRMKPNECHLNVRFMVENDPEHKFRQVTGYWPQAGNFVLHSVVEREGDYFCVTPLVLGGPDRFPFIPDPDIEWREENGYMIAYRKGIPIAPGFRSDPAEHKRIYEIVLSRINAGMHPLKAGEPPF